MNDRPGAISPKSLPRPGEVALLTAIDAALDVPVGELPGRFALGRRYVGAAMGAVPGGRRANPHGHRADAGERHQPGSCGR
jgi:hypothetical protein